MSPTTSKIAWPTTTASLCELIGIDTDAKTCHASIQKDVRRCRNKISRPNSALITCLLEKIIIRGSFSAAQTELEKVSNLIMCQNIHQKKGPPCLSKWEKILKPFEVAVIKKEDTEHTLESGEGIVKASSPTTPVMPLKQEVQVKSNIPKPQTPSRCTSQSSPSTPEEPFFKPLLPQQQTPRTSKTVHEFEDFSLPCTSLEINKKIKKLLLCSLKGSEKEPQGHIYLYTFPESYHDAQPYIKIGFANNVGKRMQRWKYQCGYEAKVLGEFLAEHHVKVEKLVHAQLRNQRKREKGCPTCNTCHHEWFKIDFTTASKTIAQWTHWMRQMPYDDEGNILDKWRLRIEGLDMNDPDCWALLSNGVFDDDTEESDLSEEGDSFAWSEDEQSELSEDDSPEVSDTGKSEFSLTDDESDDWVSEEDDDE
ncbi:hypothetical protein FBEOM_10978 [Fusarium beomiforme]|uniref:Bacteriophage T5 Orf172 DNA-binding domain-containing protein n=1 Tax=Fusarium beomiforme TaxID=44412 RepID=A0A9P5ABB4_9HYPO|nr:hypothetical protein FBEOM_10978 [Fusarium beomiforme]